MQHSIEEDSRRKIAGLALIGGIGAALPCVVILVGLELSHTIQVWLAITAIFCAVAGFLATKFFLGQR